MSEVVKFLADLFEQGYQYRSLNSYRSAISSVHDKVDGYEVGQHPLVTRLLKGVFHERPPQPRYSRTWDVSVVTSHIDTMGENTVLSLQDLTQKLVMLLALTRPSRSADLSGLNLRFRKFLLEGVVFAAAELAKQSRQSFFPAFPGNGRLCPVKALQEYELHTIDFRENDPKKQRLFLATIRLHNPVASSTIARWLRTMLERAGVKRSSSKPTQ